MIEYKIDCLDGATLNRLRASVNWDLLEDGQARRVLELALRTVTAFDGAEPVAMGRLVGGDEDYYFILDVVVRPEYQARGIGRETVTRLVGYAKNRAGRGKCPGAAVNLVAAAGKEGFYKKLGFSELRSGDKGTVMGLMLNERVALNS